LKRVFYFIYIILLITSCSPVDIYEKSVTIPRHEWKSSYKPSFEFEIRDSSVLYNIFLVLRHSEKYSFNNLYVNLHITAPGQDTATIIRRDLQLATNEGWRGTGMDDIYEIRLPLADKQPLKAGPYTFTVEQIMREDPLMNVLNVGLRLEKVK
jgi:gliding motility-associated lipoprotein GldH